MAVAGKLSTVESSPVTCAHDNTIFSKMKYTFCTNYCPFILVIRHSSSPVYPVFLLLLTVLLLLFCVIMALYFHSVDFLCVFLPKNTKNCVHFRHFYLRHFAQSIFSSSFPPCPFSLTFPPVLFSFCPFPAIAFPPVSCYNTDTFGNNHHDNWK